MGDNHDVLVEVDLRPNDVYTPFRWDRGNLARWVAAIVLCLIFYFLYKDSVGTVLSFPDGESILAVAALLWLFLMFALLVFPYLRMRANFRKSSNMTKLRRYTFQASGITTQSEDATSDAKWSVFQRADETPNVFALSLTSQAAIYIPKRCFTSGEDVTRMRALIRQNMPGKFRLRCD